MTEDTPPPVADAPAEAVIAKVHECDYVYDLSTICYASADLGFTEKDAEFERWGFVGRCITCDSPSLWVVPGWGRNANTPIIEESRVPKNRLNSDLDKDIGRLINREFPEWKRMYWPRSRNDQYPRYQVSPITDTKVFRVVERHGVEYPIARGFAPFLQRLVYGLEGTAEPLNDTTLDDYPIRVVDIGDAPWNWKYLTPYPLRCLIKPPEWHFYVRGPPYKATEKRKVKGGIDPETGEKKPDTEEEVEVEKKGKLHFFVMTKMEVIPNGVGLEGFREIVDYAHGFKANGQTVTFAQRVKKLWRNAIDATQIKGERIALEDHKKTHRHMLKSGTEGSHDLESIVAEIEQETAREEGNGEEAKEEATFGAN
jgi:hypothetical protein